MPYTTKKLIEFLKQNLMVNFASLALLITFTGTADGYAGSSTSSLILAEPNPQLAIEKTILEGANFDHVGQVIRYQIVATNTGDVKLSSVSVVDPGVDGLNCSPANSSPLMPNASMICEGTHTVVQADIDRGAYLNEACVSGGEAPEVCDTEVARAEIRQAFDFVKRVNGEDADVPPGPTVEVGNTVTFTYLVTNRGNITLDVGSVRDDLMASEPVFVCAINSIAPGTTQTCTRTVTAQAGQYSDFARATARATIGGSTPMEEDFGHYFGSGMNDPCAAGVIGGIDLGGIANSELFFFANGMLDANWQGATKGFAGNVSLNGILARERSSGGVPFAGRIRTNDSSLSGWSRILSQNAGQSIAEYLSTPIISMQEAKLKAAFTEINGLSVTEGFSSVSSTSLNGLNKQNNMACDTMVINVTSGHQISSKINITGDACDVFILRWDSDANFANGYQGQVKFQSGGAIVPNGGLRPGNFVHVAGDINSSGGGSNPRAPFPQGPRMDNGQGALIAGASDFSGGGFFTGYWLTTGAPTNYDPISKLYYGATASLSNGIFVGGWYSLTNKFSMTSGTSGVYVAPRCK